MRSPACKQNQGYSPIAHLAWACFLSGDSPERLLMFSNFTTGFFDASGKRDQPIALAVGGYVATRKRWELFEQYWKEVLPPEIEYFRMTEFVNNTEQFKGWRDRRPEKQALLEKLSAVLEECVEYSLGCVILLAEYDKVNATYALTECMGHPFPLAGFDTMKRLHDWSFQRKRMPALAVFEDGDEHKGELIDVAKRELPEILRPVFQSKKLAPLQAADIAAWDLHNVTVKVEQDADFRLWEKSVARLRRIPENHGIYTLEDLLRLCRDAKVPLRKNYTG
jgi:hypothetical protein